MSEKWMPRERWNAMVSGENCPACKALSSTENNNEHGYKICDLSISRLVLQINQYVPGYCILVCLNHVREPYELSPENANSYFNDLMRVGNALEKVYHSDKLNFLMLGNAVPHLHCHILPRYYGDDAPGKPINYDAKVIKLKPEEYQKRVEDIRNTLDLVKM
jgi:diadenosine tetraphosphate (Ap4A) HIT family hydrolase